MIFLKTKTDLLTCKRYTYQEIITKYFGTTMEERQNVIFTYRSSYLLKSLFFMIIVHTLTLKKLLTFILGYSIINIKNDKNNITRPLMSCTVHTNLARVP